MWEWIMGLAESVDGWNINEKTGYFGPNSRAPGFWSIPKCEKKCDPYFGYLTF